MTADRFAAKWSKASLTERSAAQQHFLDLCELTGHPKPAEADPAGEWFTFERGAAKHGGGEGWADVWKRGFFGFEYKGRHKDLGAAYDQLLRYREALENPPLLVVCDMDRIVIHTNFTGTAKVVHELRLVDLGAPRGLEILRHLFHEPQRLRPGATSEAITRDAARRLAELAHTLRARGLDPHDVAQFLDRLVFCLFAEDIGLLPEGLFSEVVEKTRADTALFQRYVGELFAAMATGGNFLLREIRHFNGNLFTAGPVLALTEPEIARVREATVLDWSAVDPSIFGTLFERGMDPAKRSQLGAHYTSREDIETLVEPAVMQPLRREWAEVKATAARLLDTGSKNPGAAPRPLSAAALRKARAEAERNLQRFHERLTRVRVLDPACGSGNFLYVTLQRLKDLEKEVIVHAMESGFTAPLPAVGPWQLYGIEVSPYAHELAQMTVWIGFLQWTRTNGFPVTQTPVLRRMDNFQCKDAILDLGDPAHPREAEWPDVDFIVGNPPFLGVRKMRRELGDKHVERLFAFWQGRVSNAADLCAYWFEKARAQIAAGKCRRAALLATQGIRGGPSRGVLKRIKESGGIFFAESDREWILDGANVHVSMAGFDDGSEKTCMLDGRPVSAINANLTADTDVTQARPIAANARIGFMGDTKGGAFDIPATLALEMLRAPNPHGRPNSDVLVPWVNGLDVTRRPREMWIIDFGAERTEEAAALFEMPFEFVRKHVQPVRETNKRETYRRFWWRHVEARPAMLAALAPLPCFLVTLTVSKHRLFVRMSAPTLPDHQLIAFAREDDYFFGVLQSRVHEVWARAQGTQVRERESGFRYTPTTCFETFPFPFPHWWASPPDEAFVVAKLRAAHHHTDRSNVIQETPESYRARDDRPERHKAIADAARELDALRARWLNPPEWTREEVLEFPGSIDGPWARFVREPGPDGIGVVRHPRLAARDAACTAELNRRTLTRLYNERPDWLDHAHRRLDEAVCAAYALDPAITDDALLGHLLELNLARASRPSAQAPASLDA